MRNSSVISQSCYQCLQRPMVLSRSIFYSRCITSLPRPLRRTLHEQHREGPATGGNADKRYPWIRYTGPTLLLGIYTLYLLNKDTEVHAEPAPKSVTEIVIEKPRKAKGSSKEDNRDMISSQHHQVKKSWENPGVYAWGSNSGRVVAPDSTDNVIKTPRRLAWFDGMILRDLKLDRNFGAAITEHGDLVQWGKAYDSDIAEPRVTLCGKQLRSLAVSRDRILALASNGRVYSLPVARADQLAGPRLSEPSRWIPFWSSRAQLSYRVIEPKNLAWGDKVTQVKSGLENMLLLTAQGRVFAAASSSEEFPSRGEMGIPGLTWKTRPTGAYDQPHEISTLKGFTAREISCGDYHSMVLDSEGRLFTFGDNTSGQLGFPMDTESPYIDAPSLLPLTGLYAGTGLSARITSIAAGGQNSYFTVDATPRSQDTSPPKVTADTWSCGSGIYGTLANGRWTHFQAPPTKIKSLSGLFEYDERRCVTIPIRLKRLSVGTTHMSATMDNVTFVDARDSDSENETNWGADVVWWGGNEFYQLGLGKRNNVSVPCYISPLDGTAEQNRTGGKRREEHRFQCTPGRSVPVGGRRVWLEQRVECGRMCSAVYSGSR